MNYLEGLVEHPGGHLCVKTPLGASSSQHVLQHFIRNGRVGGYPERNPSALHRCRRNGAGGTLRIGL